MWFTQTEFLLDYLETLKLNLLEPSKVSKTSRLFSQLMWLLTTLLTQRLSWSIPWKQNSCQTFSWLGKSMELLAMRKQPVKVLLLESMQRIKLLINWSLCSAGMKRWLVSWLMIWLLREHQNLIVCSHHDLNTDCFLELKIVILDLLKKLSNKESSVTSKPIPIMKKRKFLKSLWRFLSTLHCHQKFGLSMESHKLPVLNQIKYLQKKSCRFQTLK